MHDPTLHLFIDDHHIRNTIALKRVFFPLERDHKPLLTDTAGRFIGWGCTMREADKRWRMWYQSVAGMNHKEFYAAGVWGKGEELGFFPDRHPKAIPEWQTSMIGYAESDDGLNWHRPDLGLIEWQGSKRNNMVMDGSIPAKQFEGAVTNMDSVSVLLDEEEKDSSKRYKMVNHWETVHCWDNTVGNLNRPQKYMDRWWAHRAKYLTTSPDGIHWPNPLTRIKNCEGGDYCGITRDHRNQSWMFNDRPSIGLPTGYCRLAGLSYSKDLYHWPPHLDQIIHPEDFEDWGKRYEHHGFTPFNYGDQDLGFLEYSVIGQTVMNVLVTHRDGERWGRANGDTPILEVGPKGGPDDALAVITRNDPFVVDEKLLFIYNGRNKPENQENRFGGMFAAWLRLDGFAGLTVDPQALWRLKAGAVLQTRHVTVTADELQLNIAGHLASAQVALLDEGMKAIPGYDVGDGLPLPEDATRATVRWKEHLDVRALKGRLISVLVKFNAGTIYSFRL